MTEHTLLVVQWTWTTFAV